MATKHRKPTRYEENYRKLRTAFQALMGLNGEQYVEEILMTNKLSHKSYAEICNATLYCSSEVVSEYFGIIQSNYFNTIIEEKQRREITYNWLSSL